MFDICNTIGKNAALFIIKITFGCIIKPMVFHVKQKKQL